MDESITNILHEKQTNNNTVDIDKSLTNKIVEKTNNIKTIDTKQTQEDLFQQINFLNSIKKNSNLNNPDAKTSILFNIKQFLSKQQKNLTVFENKTSNHQKNEDNLFLNKARISKILPTNSNNNLTLQNLQTNNFKDSQLNKNKNEKVETKLSSVLPSLPGLNINKTNLYRDAGYEAFKNFVKTLSNSTHTSTSSSLSNEFNECLINFCKKNKNLSNKITQNTQTNSSKLLNYSNLSTLPSTSTAKKHKLSQSSKSSAINNQNIFLHTLSDSLNSSSKNLKDSNFSELILKKHATNLQNINKKLENSTLNNTSQTTNILTTSSNNFQSNVQLFAKFIDEQLLKIPEKERQKIFNKCEQQNFSFPEIQRYIINKILENYQNISQNQTEVSTSQIKSQTTSYFQKNQLQTSFIQQKNHSQVFSKKKNQSQSFSNSQQSLLAASFQHHINQTQTLIQQKNQLQTTSQPINQSQAFFHKSQAQTFIPRKIHQRNNQPQPSFQQNSQLKTTSQPINQPQAFSQQKIQPIQQKNQSQVTSQLKNLPQTSFQQNFQQHQNILSQKNNIDNVYKQLNNLLESNLNTLTKFSNLNEAQKNLDTKIQNNFNLNILQVQSDAQCLLTPQQKYLYYIVKASMEQEKSKSLSNSPATSSSNNQQQQKEESNNVSNLNLKQQQNQVEKMTQLQSNNAPKIQKDVNVSQIKIPESNKFNDKHNTSTINNQKNKNLTEHFLKLQEFFKQQNRE